MEFRCALGDLHIAHWLGRRFCLSGREEGGSLSQVTPETNFEGFYCGCSIPVCVQPKALIICWLRNMSVSQSAKSFSCGIAYPMSSKVPDLEVGNDSRAVSQASNSVLDWFHRVSNKCACVTSGHPFKRRYNAMAETAALSAEEAEVAQQASTSSVRVSRKRRP